MAAASGSNGPPPAPDRPFASPSPPEREAAVAAARTLLVIEDNPTDVFVIRQVIAKCELDVHIRVVDDGQQALRFLHELACDETLACPVLVLLDLNLPRVSGIEVLKELRRGRCARSPVIVVTSSAAQTDRTAAECVGVDAYFRKSNDLQAYMELCHVIGSVLKRTE